MSWVASGVAGASLLVGAAGTGLSFLGQQDQASNQAALADYNRKVQDQNNRINLQVAQQQAKYQQRQYEMQAEADKNNAITFRGQAGSVRSQGREQAQRMRETNEKAQATQLARVGKSGVTTEGSPLAVLSEQASLMELGVQDMAWGVNNDAENLFKSPRESDYKSQADLFNASIAKYEGEAAKAGFAVAQNNAQTDYMAGQNQAQALRGASYGTLLSGFGSALDTVGNYAYQRQQFNFQRKYRSTLTGAVV